MAIEMKKKAKSLSEIALDATPQVANFSTSGWGQKCREILSVGLQLRYNQAQDYYVRGNKVDVSRVIDFTYVDPVDTDKGTYQYGGISEYELIYEQLINDGISLFSITCTIL